MDEAPTCKIGGDHLVVRREDAWDAIAAVLLSLDGHDLIGIFQIGWMRFMKRSACTPRDAHRCGGPPAMRRQDIQSGLDMLRIAMNRKGQAGTPWRAAPSLDVIVMLDEPGGGAVALIAERPVIDDASTPRPNHRARAIDAQAFTFIRATPTSPASATSWPR